MKMQKWFLGLIIVAAMMVVAALVLQTDDEEREAPVVTVEEDSTISTDYSSPPPEETKSKFSNLNQISDLSIETVSDIYPTSVKEIEVKINNKTDSTFTFGDSFYIEREYNGSWYSAPNMTVDELAFNDIGYDITAKKDRFLSHKLWMYNDLPSGNYRIIKDALYVRKPGDYDKHYIAALFKVAD